MSVFPKDWAVRSDYRTDDGWQSRKWARKAIKLHVGAADAIYAQALLQATGALEEF